MKVVSFASGQQRYIDGARRLKDTIPGAVVYTSEAEIGSPPHSEVPYAFKAYAIEKHLPGLVLWLDSVVYARGDLQEIEEYIKREGVMLFNNIGFSVADYTNDACLSYFGITRAKARHIPMIMACCMGLTDCAFTREYIAAAKAVPSPYLGSWDDHRHDQSVASILAWKHKVAILTGHETFFTYEDHPAMQPVSQTVKLFSK